MADVRQGLIDASGVAGLVLYFLTGWLYLGSGLVVPLPWFVLFWVAWLLGWIVAIQVFRRSRRWTPIVAISAVVIWAIAVQLGSWLFGWTA